MAKKNDIFTKFMQEKWDKLQLIAPAEFRYRGYTLDQLLKLELMQFAQLLPAKERRILSRGLSERAKKLISKLMRSQKPVKTHLRDLIILPQLVGKELEVHNGKHFVRVRIVPEMIGHRLGEFAFTRRPVKHGAAGVGATRSSKYIPLK